ncbi:MAG: response regulator [Chloroflexi bacterium]|nr:MAG: response regulator [Chloroflexota bacterium]TMF02069.1 MAG: response regulator [Chloroflexota bacterium]TMG24978.1 MAG: response regulator [Chloroflexota bacterium]
MSLGPGVELGPYSVVERIGRGGMATVYKAYHAALDRYVAIKVLPEFFAEDEEYRERFHQEAMSVARLRHPNILSVYDFGHERGIAYLVLELISGGTLADRLGTRIDIHDTVAMLKPIADALDHAHRNGVLHRDIKPSNILLHRDGTPVLADFGLAKLAASVRRLTASGIVMGTPEYMSPEQAAGDPIGPPSDLYAFAIVAYEMLTGRVPFEADTPAAVLLSHLNKAMPAMHELRGELSRHAEDALRRALAKSPSERFQTATEFVAALTPAAWPTAGQSEQAVTAVAARRPPSGPTRKLPSVLVVDDGVANRELIEACLAGVECEVRLAADGPSALAAVDSREPDLVLLDVQMPGMDGHEVCRRIKSDPNRRLIPIVMITALNSVSDRVTALESGADDFMSKPVERVELVARVKSSLRLKAVYDKLDNAEQVIFALAAAVEAKEAHTSRHVHRVADAARHIGARLGMKEEELDQLYRGALLHDVGKIGVLDSILSKPGPLDAQELIKVREHPQIGVDIVRPLRSTVDIVPTIRHHHEWFDGRGYPGGLIGQEIPVHARIVAVCDAYDSMVSDRPYRAGRSVEETVRILQAGAGKQWDPELVTQFLAELAIIAGLTAA